MKVYSGRQTGKTTKLIKESHETGIKILVPNEQRKKFVIQMARNIVNLDIPSPITVTDLRSLRTYGMINSPKDLLIDNFEECLKMFLGHAKIHSIALDKEHSLKIDNSIEIS